METSFIIYTLREWINSVSRTFGKARLLFRCEPGHFDRDFDETLKKKRGVSDV
jgi:hypothetical protein